ncbi:MAG: response regulator [Candidatus Latescibacterota bacterium]
MLITNEPEIHPGESTLSPGSDHDSPDQMTGYIAHEFNNLFAGLLLNISAARLAIESPDEALHYLERAESEVARGRAVIRLLSILTDRRPLHREVIPVAALANCLASGTGESPAIFRGQHSLPPLQVAVDREGMALVIRSLAERMTRGVRTEGMDISIEETLVSRNDSLSLPMGRYARIELEYRGADSGGDFLERPFHRYSSDAGRGVDLALAACQALISRHGGALQRVCRGERPSGFSVYLPAFLRESMRNGSSEPVRTTPGKGRILLMDDEESIRTIVEILFGKLGYDITTVSDGASAVETYRKAMDEGNPYQVVIMDLIVPFGMGGKEAMQIMREINPDVRAVVSSGYSADSVMERFREYGFSASVEKPYRLETLLETVQQLL